MYYGVKFDDKHSLTDWGLYMIAPPEISSPDVVTYETEIPGADGTLDLTESLTGTAVYRNRRIRFRFMSKVPVANWRALHGEISRYLHGKQRTIICDDDPNYYWEGRCYLDEWELDGRLSYITISAVVSPFRWERDLTTYSVTIPMNEDYVQTLTDWVLNSSTDVASDIRFGTAAVPSCDFSVFSRVSIYCKNNLSTSTTVTVIESSGKNYSQTLEYGTVWRHVVLEMSDIVAAGLDPAKIWAFYVQFGTDCTIFGVVDSDDGAVKKITAGTRIKDLVVSQSKTSAVVDAVFCNGQYSALRTGVNSAVDIPVAEGENDLIFDRVSGKSGEVEITYRNGWL